MSQSNEEYKNRVVVNWSALLVSKEGQQQKITGGDVMMQNQGTAICMIDNKWRLLPGQGITFGANWNEVNIHTYQFNWIGPGTKSVALYIKNLPRSN